MGPKFFQTMMGKRFIEGTVPLILSELKRLNNNLETINSRLEIIAEAEEKSEKEE